MLTLADEAGRGGLDPPFLADIISEQPLRGGRGEGGGGEGGGERGGRKV